MKLFLGVLIGIVLTLGLGWIAIMILGYKMWEDS